MAQNFYSSVPNKNDVVFDDLTKMNENFNTLRSSFSGDTQPESAVAGQLWFDTSENKMKYHTGSSWKGLMGNAESAISFTPSEETTWTAISDLPVALQRHGAVAYNNKIYVFGGKDSSGAVNKVVYEYDINTNTWSTKSSSTYEHEWAGYALLNGKIYVVNGGTNDYKHEVYDIASDSWTTVADYPISVSYFYGYGAAYDNKIYMYGGFDGTNYRNETYEYDPDTNSWTAKSNMPNTNGYGSSAIIGSCIYVLGGRTTSSTDNLDVYRYNVITDKWETLTTIPSAKMGCSTAICNFNKILMLGGNEGSSYVNTVFVYDVITNTVSQDSINLDTARYASAAIYVYDYIYTFGGFDGSDTLKTAVKRQKTNSYKISLDIGDALIIKETSNGLTSFIVIADEEGRGYGSNITYADTAGNYYVMSDNSIEIVKISK